MSGYSIVIGYCYGCKKKFGFNPYHCPSILVDPTTGYPPDLDANGNPRELETDAVERSRREPLCRDCVETSNRVRAEQGREPFPIHPDAYEPMEGGYI